MRLNLNKFASLVASGCLAVGTLAAQTGKEKCSYADVTGKVLTVLCVDAPPGAKPITPPVTTQTPAAAQAFPFPGAPAAASATQNTSAQTGTSAPADASTPASKRFPFPGETPDAEPVTPNTPSLNPNGLQDAGSQGDSTRPLPDQSSSSSSSSSSSTNPDTTAPDPNDPPDAAPIPHHSRRPLPTVKEKTPDEREAEDVSVAAFYQGKGNFQAAYMRGKDAVSLDDTDPEAHLALAEAARRLGKLDEAQQHYKRCLELDPLPKDKKAAQQALKEMAGKG